MADGDDSSATLAPRVRNIASFRAETTPQTFQPARDAWQRCCYCLWHIQEGSGLVHQRGRQLRLLAGGVVLTQPGQSLRLGPGSFGRRLAFDLLPRCAAGDLQDSAWIPQPDWEALFSRPLPAPLPDPLREQSIRLIDDQRHRYWIDDDHARRAALALHQWVISVAYGKDPPLHAHGPLHEACALIEANLENGITVHCLATLLHISRQTLDARIRDATGQAPGRLIRDVRLHRAEADLAQPEPSPSIDAIAKRCGFRSTSAFSQWFRRETGVSPTCWRQRTDH